MARIDGSDRGATRYRHAAQLPLLRPGLHPSGRRRPRSAGQLRHLCRLWRLRNRGAGHLALLTVKVRQLFWAFVVAFNIVGMVDLIVDYYQAIQADLPAHAGLLGAAYAIPILYVPLLMITHVTAFYFLLRPHRSASRAITENARAS
ncbi:hypothetical protein X742_23630 [Mesorhizobium sp. LNHC232B00]|nr:hypothetical protein X742_23630 [Mesorhizobium sp. LNHC232B00]